MMASKTGRRAFLAGLGTLPVLAACAPTPPAPPYRPLYLGGDLDQEVFLDLESDSQAKIHGVPEPREVAVSAEIAPGQILVHQKRLVIQYVHAEGRAREYAVGLGKAGLEFSGSAIIERKAEWPSWRPTDAMIARNPEHYGKYADGVPGGPSNPLGARALYLYKDGVDTYYRIHGTDAPETIGSYVSNGCIRMLNEQVEELYDLVPLGTVVRVV